MGRRCIEDCTGTPTVSCEKHCQRNTKCECKVPNCHQSLTCVRLGGTCMNECPWIDANCKCAIRTKCSQEDMCTYTGGSCMQVRFQILLKDADIHEVNRGARNYMWEVLAVSWWLRHNASNDELYHDG